MIGGGSRAERAVVLIAAAAFVLALAVRLQNAPVAFADGIPQVKLLDDLYHLKRMAYTAAQFPRVLDFDPDRGERGAFCPWPPLYDFASGAAAALFGARAPGEVLARVVWIPPIVTALFIALAAGWAARRYGWPAGATLAAALALSPFSLVESSIGNIDHHFLEAPLLFGIIGATCMALRARGRREALAAGLWLAAALSAAMFIRTALLIAAALSFAVLFAFTDGVAAACGFGLAAAAVAIFRLTRPAGYPDQQWFLGWSHAALLGGAAAAGAVMALSRRPRPQRHFLALACGAAVVLATPSAPASILFGSEYIGGNAWFRTIAEAQPLLRFHGEELAWKLSGVAVGTVLAAVLAIVAVRRRDVVAGTVAGFALVYLLLTFSTIRYQSASIPLLALAGVVLAMRVPARWRAAVLLAVAVPMVVLFAVWTRRPAELPIGPRELPWIRAASFLREQRGGGRVLAPWSLGHVLDVFGERGVVIDNFGIMSNEEDFNRAHDAFITLHETALLRYCRGAGVRFVVLDNPLYGLNSAASTLALDGDRYVPMNDRGEPLGVTKLAARTWWWRAYYGQPFEHFRLVYADPQPSWQGTATFRGPAIMIWERVER